MGVACSKHDTTVDGSHPHNNNNYYQQQMTSGSTNPTRRKTPWTGCLSSCSGIDPAVDPRMDSCRADAIDPVMYDLCRKSLNMTLQDEEQSKKEEAAPPQPTPKQKHHVGQYHLLYKHQTKPDLSTEDTCLDKETVSTVPSTSPYATRLIVRRRPIASAEEGSHGTHLYAIRYPPDDIVEQGRMLTGNNSDSSNRQEQCPTPKTSRGKKGRNSHTNTNMDPAAEPIPEPPRPSPAPPQLVPTEGLQDFFQPARMKQAKTSKQTIKEWVTVSEEHCIYVVDVGLKPAQCDKIVQVTEQVCRGQYAAYTYAKQTLGCREFPILAQACAPPVQSVVQAILGLPSSKARAGKDPQQHLQLDDREPHLVKYDVTKKERQKLDMHTDKSEWTFLIALSNGCGLDYDGGGTYFECLNATIHVQRGHALIFPGKLRHCGQRITRGLRYLLVGFLVDKAHLVTSTTSTTATKSTSSKTNENESDNSNKTTTTNSNAGGGDSSSGTKPVSAKTLTGMPTTYASA